MPSQTLVVTLECAGNGRALFQPPIEGEKWNLGAVSTAEWTGVPLVELLDRAGGWSSARDVVFRGADGGAVDGHAEPIRFERSLSLDDARDENVLLAYAMNGAPPPVEHGFPLRLIVPGWYAVAAVKWLTEIELVDRPFTGHYQAGKYWYDWTRGGGTVREPVTLQQVRALITEPTAGGEVPRGQTIIRGVAGERKRHGWQWWELIARFDEPGDVTCAARATDLAGRTQPERAEWNRLGYGNNAIQHVPIRIV